MELGHVQACRVTCAQCNDTHEYHGPQIPCPEPPKKHTHGARLCPCDPAVKRIAGSKGARNAGAFASKDDPWSCALCRTCAQLCSGCHSPLANCWFLSSESVRTKAEPKRYKICIYCQAAKGESAEEVRLAAQALLASRGQEAAGTKDWEHRCSRINGKLNCPHRTCTAVIKEHGSWTKEQGVKRQRHGEHVHFSTIPVHSTAIADHSSSICDSSHNMCDSNSRYAPAVKNYTTLDEILASVSVDADDYELVATEDSSTSGTAANSCSDPYHAQTPESTSSGEAHGHSVPGAGFTTDTDRTDDTDMAGAVDSGPASPPLASLENSINGVDINGDSTGFGPFCASFMSSSQDRFDEVTANSLTVTHLQVTGTYTLPSANDRAYWKRRSPDSIVANEKLIPGSVVGILHKGVSLRTDDPQVQADALFHHHGVHKFYTAT